MNKVSFCAVSHPGEWIKMVAEQLKVPVIDNKILLPNDIGEGWLKDFYPTPWLTVSYFRFKIFNQMFFERTSVSNSPFVPVMFYLDNLYKQKIDNKETTVGVDTTNGIFMPSSQIETKWQLPTNTWFTNLTLTFDKDWLTNEFKEDSYINNLIYSGKSFYVFESLSPFIVEQIKLIEKNIDSKSGEEKLILYSDCIKLFSLYLQQLNKRGNVTKSSGIHNSDIQTVFHVRKILLNNIENPPTLIELAKEANMSVSKMQRCFKQVFGKNISAYTISQKMENAKEMFISQRLSVSEVGYQLGYSNLSHFSKAFKKHFGIKPKDFLSRQNYTD